MKTLLSALILLVVAAGGPMHPTFARDNGQWTATDQAISKWYRELKQPDHPRVSCCGEADAYYSIRSKLTATTTSPSSRMNDDAPLGRPHIPPGTRIAVPNHKMKWDAGSPTGHGVIFVGVKGYVYCYVAPGGV
jgi:hypothetical protein